MPQTTPLPAARLHATYDKTRIPWTHSGEIPEVGAKNGRDRLQPRAMEALDLALQVRTPGWHVYLSGEADLGRRHMLETYLTPRARQMATPPDLVYVRNFRDADEPVLMTLPAGQGKEFRDAMAATIQSIGPQLEKRLDGRAYLKQRATLADAFQENRSALMRQMNEKAREQGFGLELDGEGAVSLSPLQDGKKINEDAFGQMDADKRLDLRSRGDRLAKSLAPYARQLAKAEENLRESERKLDAEAMGETLDTLLSPLEKRFCKSAPDESMQRYFSELRADITKNTAEFLPGDPRREETPGDFLERYAVNLFVDNSSIHGAPVIVEDNPNAANLLGCMERESEMGALVTDVTLIRAGSLQRANGGFLAVHVEDLLQHSDAWEGLLRSLRANESRLEDTSETGEGSLRAKTLRPAPLPLQIKVILIGNEDLYEHLLEHDDRFAKLFRIKAHMTGMAGRNAANIKVYFSQLAQIIRAADLLPFDAGALAWLVDLGSHLCEDQKRLSLQFPIIREVMIEADALARMSSLAMVDAATLESAWAARDRRANLVEEDFMEEYDRELIKVCTSGSAVGQVNGLSVCWSGGYEFGLPHRISCTVGVGHEGLVDLEREAELGGPIHTKAMMIIKSFLNHHFAVKKPLVLSASLYFEQSYAGIEGDSASGAELAALISALAGVPARLDLAFTGAVSHSGQILAVGGVTRKIEGFYKVCSRRGLTGTQGVIIPRDNVDHLMLSPEILQSVEEGRFAIYSVRTMEEALELLTGMPPGRRHKDGGFTRGSLYDLADRRLEQLGACAQNAFRRPRKDTHD